MLRDYIDHIDIYLTRKNEKNVKKLLLSDFKAPTKWFHDNYMIKDWWSSSFAVIGNQIKLLYA